MSDELQPAEQPPTTDQPPVADEANTAVEAAPESDPRTHRFECRSCGYVYDPAGFRCPVCRSRKPAFRDIGPRTKASGFEENLNFGIGVNRMTPGQKNVLIFGGLALAFAFFLSLYSLR